MAKGDITTILTAATGAGNSSSFYVAPKNNVTIMTDADLAGVEVAAVEISYDNGSNWNPYLDGAAVVLSVSINALRLYGPAVYRVAKASSAAETGIILQE